MPTFNAPYPPLAKKRAFATLMPDEHRTYRLQVWRR
jgi:hypothetical protein